LFLAAFVRAVDTGIPDHYIALRPWFGPSFTLVSMGCVQGEQAEPEHKDVKNG